MFAGSWGDSVLASDFLNFLLSPANNIPENHKVSADSAFPGCKQFAQWIVKP
jgi:hypothetical protein